MTTYLLLALTDDGRVLVDRFPIHYLEKYGEVGVFNEVRPVRTGTDRNAYSTYEVAGYSIDVVRLPEEVRRDAISTTRV